MPTRLAEKNGPLYGAVNAMRAGIECAANVFGVGEIAYRASPGHVHWPTQRLHSMPGNTLDYTRGAGESEGERPITASLSKTAQDD